MKIVVIEDEPDIQTLLTHTLTQAGFIVKSAASGEAGLTLIETWKPKLVVMDVMLPNMTGLSLCKRIKTNPDTQSIHVILVSAKSDESDILVGLDMGADDYIPKPFSPKILVAKIRRFSSDRRINEYLVDCQVGPFRICPDSMEVWIDDVPISLTTTEFRILLYLAQNSGKVFSRNQIIDSIKGERYAVTDRTIDVLMVGLRRKLGDHAGWIETIRSVGYRFRR